MDEMEEDTLTYIFFILVSQAYYLLVCLLIGGLLGHTMAALVFFLAFNILRRYAGGMHATTEYRCMAISTGLIVATMVCVHFLTITGCKWFWVPVGVAAILVFFLAPVESIEKPLSPKRRKQNRITSTVIAFVGFGAVLLLENSAFRFPIGMAILDESVLLFFGKIREGKF